MDKTLDAQQATEILSLLQKRFEKNSYGIKTSWATLQAKLEAAPHKIWSLYQMEKSGGAPALVAHDPNTDCCTFYDCAPESPSGRRSSCYDREALESRKEHAPAHNAADLAESMNIQLMDEAQYRHLQTLGSFDQKTSSWLRTPEAVRKLGGAIFGDLRYGRVFIYHNGAQSYYAARGFRGVLEV